jgi:hypothetical protein
MRTMTEVHDPPAVDDFTDEPISDLAALLSAEVGPGELEALAQSLIGEAAVREAGLDDGDFMMALVEALRAAGRLAEAVNRMRFAAHPGSHLSVALSYIMDGGRLGEDDALQALTHEYEPYIQSEDFVRCLQRMQRQMCAIGLGEPHNVLNGSGFLVGPDLVMTNYHVVKPFLMQKDGRILSAVKGDRITCFFDYLAVPKPVLPHVPQPHDAFIGVPAVSDDWLVYARENLPYEGQKQCPPDAADRYDYAVIRLSRRIGRLPVRTSGGPPRGWLPLPLKIDLTPERRIVLHQHPQQRPQQFDVGRYAGDDVTKTRVRYALSSGRGSSGSAAVDLKGELFALHTALVVKAKAKDPQLNQGVRIDLIASDLAANVSDWNPPQVPERVPLWSLTDDLGNPRPIIGRDDFFAYVDEMQAPSGPRSLVVWGPPGCGLEYSTKLLKRAVGDLTPIVVFKPRHLASFTPDHFLRILVNDLGLSGLASRPLPEPNPAEDFPRWIRALAKWLRGVLDENARRKQKRFPAWVVLDTVVPSDERFLWKEPLRELIASLAGAREEGQPRIEIPQLRLLFLTSSPQSVPTGGAECREDDLSKATSAHSEFMECLRRAWKSVDAHEDPAQDEVLACLARIATQNKEQSERKALSNAVREIILMRLARRPR